MVNKIPKISFKELEKWTKILGVYRMKELFFMNKVYLTSEQLNWLIEEGKRDEEKHKRKTI